MSYEIDVVTKNPEKNYGFLFPVPKEILQEHFLPKPTVDQVLQQRRVRCSYKKLQLAVLDCALLVGKCEACHKVQLNWLFHSNKKAAESEHQNFLNAT